MSLSSFVSESDAGPLAYRSLDSKSSGGIVGLAEKLEEEKSDQKEMELALKVEPTSSVATCY